MKKISTTSLTTLTASLSISTPATRVRSGAASYRYIVRAVEGGGGCVVIRHRRPTGANDSASRRSFSTSSSPNSSNGSSGGSSSSSLAGSGAGSGHRGRNAMARRSYVRSNASGTFFDSSRSRSFHHQALPSSPSAADSALPSSEASPSPPYGKQSFTAEASFALTPLGSSIAPPPPSSLPVHSTAAASGSNTAPAPTIAQSKHSDKATFFTSGLSTPYPAQALPAFFGTTLSSARRSNLIFRNGAYGIPKAILGDEDMRRRKGKGREEQPRETSEPEHNLSIGIGEDAYFLRSDSLGVADGVGGWSGHAGANPARWSRKLMHHCSTELARYENVEDELFLQYYEVDPVDILQRAFERSLIECKEEGVIGSSTALLAVLRNDELRLANMGDCCCSIIRGNDYIFRSEEQQHSFNFPVQAGTSSRDTPIKDAQRFNIKVQKDDIVILCSDGLVDNLFDEDILEEVLRFVATAPAPSSSSTSNHAGSRYTLNRFSPQAVSEALCLRAKSVYEDQRAVSSPFQQRAMEEGIHYTGGKRDDVTCVVASIGELEASPDRR